MKKQKKWLFLFLLFAIVISSCSEQEKETTFQTSKRYLTEFNGEEWNNCNRTSKIDFAIGFLSAHGGVATYFNQRAQSEYNPEIKDVFILLRDFFLIETTAHKLVAALDGFYSVEENREVPIWAAIYNVVGIFTPVKEKLESEELSFDSIVT